MKILIILLNTLFLMLVTGCGGSSDESATPPVDDNTITPKFVTLSGTVAFGIAVANANVVVTDKDNNIVDATTNTDANGKYSIEFSNAIPTPMLISVITKQSERLIAIVDDPLTEVANINPITSYVANSILAETELSTITAGDVSTVGQEVVNSIFGDGALYDAFSTDNFIAKSGLLDFTTQVSTADVLLDSINELSGTTDVVTFIAQVAEADSTLLDSAEFVTSIATNLALVVGNNTSINEVYDLTLIDAKLSAQLSNVTAFQEIAEAVISIVESSDLTPEQEISASSGLIDIIKNSVINNDIIDLDSARTVYQNVLDNLLDEIITVVTSNEVQSFSPEMLIATTLDVSGDIINILDGSGIDLSSQNIDFSIIEAELAEVTLIENATDWNNGKWGSLTWQ